MYGSYKGVITGQAFEKGKSEMAKKQSWKSHPTHVYIRIEAIHHAVLQAWRCCLCNLESFIVCSSVGTPPSLYLPMREQAFLCAELIRDYVFLLLSKQERKNKQTNQKICCASGTTAALQKLYFYLSPEVPCF